MRAQIFPREIHTFQWRWAFCAARQLIALPLSIQQASQREPIHAANLLCHSVHSSPSRGSLDSLISNCPNAYKKHQSIAVASLCAAYRFRLKRLSVRQLLSLSSLRANRRPGGKDSVLQQSKPPAARRFACCIPKSRCSSPLDFVFVFQVVPDLLHIVVVLECVEQTAHLHLGLLLSERCGGCRHLFHLSGGKCVALFGESV